MRDRKELSHVLNAALFHSRPIAGDCYQIAGGKSVLCVNKVRNVLGDRSGPAFRLFGHRVLVADLPSETSILPWPKRPSRAAMPQDQSRVPHAITTQSQARTAERKRVLAHNRMLRDPTHLVEPIRLESGSAVAADWVDPDDLNPNRRVARVVHGFRTRDQIDILIDNGSINRGQAGAAKRFRKQYELGELGLKNAPNLLEARGGFEAGSGPSEHRLMWLEAWQATCRAVRPAMLGVLMSVIIEGSRIREFSEIRQISPSVAMGLLISGLSFLVDYFSEIDRLAEDKSS
jgi:hypothetical protein